MLRPIVPIGLLVLACARPPVSASRRPLVPLMPLPGPVELRVSYLGGPAGSPIYGMRAHLYCCLAPGRLRDSTVATADAAGRVLFPRLLPGHYLLTSRAIGYKARVDTLIIGVVPPPRLEITMVVDTTCLGACPPDRWLVAAARARRDEWGCAADRGEIQEVLDHWIPRLATEGDIRAQLGLSLSRVEITRQIRRVTDQNLCRRAANYFDARGDIATLDFVLFRLGEWILVAPSNEAWVFLVFNRKFELKANFSVVQE